MAVKYGVNRTNERSTPPVQSVINMNTGSLRIIYEEYDASASGANLTAGDTVEIGVKIPLGFKVVGGKAYFGAGATGGTVKIGDAQDDDRYLTATSCAAAGDADFDAIDGIGYEPTGAETNDDQQIVATFAVAAFAAKFKMYALVVGPQ